MCAAVLRALALLVLAAAGATPASPGAAQTPADPFVPPHVQIETVAPTGIPSSWLSRELFDGALQAELARALGALGAPVEAGATRPDFYVLNQLQASAERVVWIGCLDPGFVKSANGCSHTFAPVEVGSVGDIATIATMIAGEIRSRMSARTVRLHLGCRGEENGLDPLTRGLLITKIAEHVGKSLNIEIVASEPNCSGSLSGTEARLLVVANRSDDRITFTPELFFGSSVYGLIPITVPYDEDSGIKPTQLGELAWVYGEDILSHLSTGQRSSGASALLATNRTNAAQPAAGAGDLTGLVKAQALRVAGQNELAAVTLPRPEHHAGSDLYQALRLERGRINLGLGRMGDALADLAPIALGFCDEAPAEWSGERTLQRMRAFAAGPQAVQDARACLARAGPVGSGAQLGLLGDVVEAAYFLEHFDVIGPIEDLAAAIDARGLATTDIPIRSAQAAIVTSISCQAVVEGNLTSALSQVINLRVDARAAAEPERRNKLVHLLDWALTVALDSAHKTLVAYRGPAESAVGELLEAVRRGAEQLDLEDPVRANVLRARHLVVRALANPSETGVLPEAQAAFERAIVDRETTMRLGGPFRHPLLDFELAEAEAMQRLFVPARASAERGLAFLRTERVQQQYREDSTDIIVAVFRALARTGTAPVEIIRRDFEQILMASGGNHPSVTPVGSTFPSRWNFGTLHQYATKAFEGVDRDVTVAVHQALMQHMEKRSVGCR